LPPLSCRTNYSISGGSLYSRNNVSRRYNVAIEAQNQKECHSMNLSVQNKLRQRLMFKSVICYTEILQVYPEADLADAILLG